jgi:hypothetical protein
MTRGVNRLGDSGAVGGQFGIATLDQDSIELGGGCLCC